MYNLFICHHCLTKTLTLVGFIKMKRKADVDLEIESKRKKNISGTYKNPKSNLKECKPGDFYLSRKGDIRKALNHKGRMTSIKLCATKDCALRALKEGKCLSCNSGRTPNISPKNQIRALPDNIPINMVKGREKYVQMCTTDQRTKGPRSFEQDGRKIETHGFECIKCNEIFPIFFFQLRPRCSFGVELRCPLCVKKRDARGNEKRSTLGRQITDTKRLW